MFGSATSIIISIIVICLVEYYCFAALKAATKNLNATQIKRAKIIYWILNSMFWIAMLTMPKYMNGVGNVIIDQYLVVMAMGGVFAKIIVAVLMLLQDVVLLFKKIILKNNQTTDDIQQSKIARPYISSRIILAIGACIVGLFLYGTKNKYNYQVKHVTLHHHGIPEAFDGTKIAHFTDLHAGSIDDPNKLREGIDMIMSEQPDLILFTGDIVNSVHDELLPCVDILSRLKAPLGVFAVMGNHDYGQYHKWPDEQSQKANLDALLALYPKMGWELLMNEHTVFDKYGERIGLIGVENWSAQSNFPKYGQLNKALQDLDTKSSDFNILMSHDPSHWKAEVLKSNPKIHLTLSGHTHAMQFGFNALGIQWSPVKYVYDEWLGLYQDGDQYLYVNPGFGFIGYKGRVGFLPEITIIELKRK